MVSLLSLSWSDAATPPGWSALFRDEVSAWQDRPLDWQAGAAPSWLQGSYVKNGPARLEVGPNQTRHYTNWMDGWGKLHSFAFRHGSPIFLRGASEIFNVDTRSRIYLRPGCSEGGLSYSGRLLRNVQ